MMTYEDAIKQPGSVVVDYTIEPVDKKRKPGHAGNMRDESHQTIVCPKCGRHGRDVGEFCCHQLVMSGNSILSIESCETPVAG